MRLHHEILCIVFGVLEWLVIKIAERCIVCLMALDKIHNPQPEAEP